MKDRSIKEMRFYSVSCAYYLRSKIWFTVILSLILLTLVSLTSPQIVQGQPMINSGAIFIPEADRPLVPVIEIQIKFLLAQIGGIRLFSEASYRTRMFPEVAINEYPFGLRSIMNLFVGPVVSYIGLEGGGTFRQKAWEGCGGMCYEDEYFPWLNAILGVHLNTSNYILWAEGRLALFGFPASLGIGLTLYSF